MSYRTFTLKIYDLQNISYEHDIGGSIPGHLHYDKLTEMSVDCLNYWINFSVDKQEETPGQILCKLADLQTLGLHLYRILFGDENVRAAFMRTYESFLSLRTEDKTLRLRLRLEFNKPAEKLARLPWEFLFVPAGGEIPTLGEDVDGFFFAGENQELVLTRSVPGSKLVDQLKKQEAPLRILIVISSPDWPPGLDTLDKQEIETVKHELRGLMSTNRVTVEVREDLTWEQLKAELNPELPKRPPHILHYIGHGEAGKIAMVMDEKDSEYRNMVFDKSGMRRAKKPVKWYMGNDLRGLLPQEDDKLRLVFLQVCKGAAPSTLDSFRSTASQLVYADVPAVVAMQYSISNDDARLFAKTFYQHIAEGNEIDEAVKAGRIELGRISPSWQHPRFGTPVVYLQSSKLQTSNAIIIPGEDEKPQQIECPYFTECHQMLWSDRQICLCQLRRGQDLKMKTTIKPIDESMSIASQSPDTREVG